MNRDIVTAPASALDAVPLIAKLSDDDLDRGIANGERVVPLVDAVYRLYRVERGRRTEKYERAGKVTPGVTISGDEKRIRTEEMLVAKWYDEDIDAEGFVLVSGWRKCVTEARARGYGKPPISKPQLGNGKVSHPARFSDPILKVIEAELPKQGTVLDPFAGTGRIHQLATETRTTVGVEIESEWAALHPDTIEGNALDLASAGIEPGTVDAIATSPTYGNRLADSHKAADPDTRRSYTHDLGHALHEDNSGDLQWGDEYRRFHEAAYREAITALKPGGQMVVNISDHIRGREWQAVAWWHLHVLTKLGLVWGGVKRVETRRLQQGANASARAEYEYVITMSKSAGGQ